jgi:hypothetical protein
LVEHGISIRNRAAGAGQFDILEKALKDAVMFEMADF